MDLTELLDESGLQQDEWSLAAPTFGKEGQLEVVGWSGRLHRLLSLHYRKEREVCIEEKGNKYHNKRRWSDSFV